MIRTGLVLVVCLGLVGCATVSREECLAGDWTAIGQRDGAAGRDGAAIFARHERACARLGETPDRTAWQAGYAAGLRDFCTPLGGLRAGEAGRPDRSGLCPATARAGFEEGYALGLRAHRQRERIRSIAREARSLRSSDPRDVRPTEPLMLQLERQTAQRELARIEREIAAFRARQ